MPEGEKFWNPYRWVTVSGQAVQHDAPHYHHTSSGLSGRLWCELEALTPLLIGDGQGEFVRHHHTQQPYIPATSLKGALRSLAEVVGNAAVPFPNQTVDPQHRLDQARIDKAAGPQFDVVARTFGYLQGSNVFAGLIHLSDAEMTKEIQPPRLWPQYQVAVGQPKPAHEAFYGKNDRRKFYHHHAGATQLVGPHPGIPKAALRCRQPAPPGTVFSFTVDFANLRVDELNWLLYCLVLEEQASVTLERAALAPGAQQPVTLNGPLRHKIGGAKPYGAGSVHIRITKMTLRKNVAARYRGQDSVVTWEENDAIRAELDSRTASFCRRTDTTMQELRAMLIYTVADPRRPIHYPKYNWFKAEGNDVIPLKPTM